MNNVTLTLVSLYSDAYNYHMVVTLEKTDHTTFKGIEQLNLMDIDFETKEEIAGRSRQKEEAAKMATSGQPAISFEEMVKAEAEKDENLKQFIHEDGTIHEEGLDMYQLRMLDAVGNELWPSRGSSRTDYHGIEVVEEYNIFDIPNIEALSRYKLKVIGEETEIMDEGPWNMDVKMEPTKEKLTKACNETITYDSHQQAVIKGVELSPLSLVMKVENENRISNRRYIGNITPNRKDGSKITLDGVILL